MTKQTQSATAKLSDFCLSCVIVVFACATAGASAQSTNRDAWSILRHKTGWVFLGAIDGETRSWVTTVHYIIRKTSKPSDLPAAADLIELTKDHELFILYYQTSGEQRRLSSPAGMIMEKRHRTGIILPPKSRVVVEELRLDPSTSGPQGVWVRVAPEPIR